jgi:putative Holliday junction resolvase
MRILAVDPGERRLGIAISDPGGIIANPLTVVIHVSRQIDAGFIANLALENQAGLIIVGQTLDDDGHPDYTGRKATRLAEAIRLQTDIPVELWDESNSTQAARRARIEMGVNLAATFILQTYLDARSPS